MLAGLIGIGLVFAFMLIHYRLPGVVACIALIFYTLVIFALFRPIPVTLTLAGIAGFVLSVGMAVDANILIFERTKEELRAGKTLTAAIEAGFNRAWNSILDSNVSTLMTAGILWYFGSSTVKGFALVLIIGVLISMFTAITLSRMMLRWVVRQPWARQAAPYGVSEDEFVDRRPARPRRARLARVFDVIGKRRWFFLFSGLITIPGLIFILLTLHPGGKAGPAVLDRLHRRHDLGGPLRRRHAGPGGGPAVLEAQGLRQGHRRPPTVGQYIAASERRATCSLSACRRLGAHRSRAGAVRRRPSPIGVSAPQRRRRRPRPPGRLAAELRPRVSPSAAPEPVAEPVGQPDARRRRRRRAPRAARAGVGRAHRGQARRAGGRRCRPRSGPSTRSRQATSVGPVVSARAHPADASCSSSSARWASWLWITFRFRDFRMGVTALVALLHDVIVVVGIFAILGTFFRAPDRRPVRDRDADRHRLQRPRHHRGLRPHPREPLPPRRRAASTPSSTTASCRRWAAPSTPR